MAPIGTKRGLYPERGYGTNVLIFKVLLVDGTVFELTPGSNCQWSEWSETVLHSFHRDGNDGANPFAGATFDKAGSAGRIGHCSANFAG